MRDRNTRLYRLAHWPIWIWVFFLAPGPLTFSLFAHGFGRGNLAWLALVLVGTGIAALRGSLPGAEPAPYILRFDEDKPNPLYRRVCYTFAWNAVLSFALLNLAGLVIAVATGTWYMKQIYNYAYAPLCVDDPAAGRGRRAAAGSRVHQRRRHGAALLLWLGVGGGHRADTAAGGVEDAAGNAHRELRSSWWSSSARCCWWRARRIAETLPRTRPIVAGESMVAD